MLLLRDGAKPIVGIMAWERKYRFGSRDTESYRRRRRPREEALWIYGNCVISRRWRRSCISAAPRLHISQPPLSLTIRQLEQEIGALLLERGNKTVALTAAGAVLYQQAGRLLADEVADTARRAPARGWPAASGWVCRRDVVPWAAGRGAGVSAPGAGRGGGVVRDEYR